jgi:hypothetical protein
MRSALLLTIAIFPPLFVAHGQTPTWSSDIACIIHNNCSRCHYQGGVAPISLNNYHEVFTYRYAVRAAIRSGHMPPWPPDPNYQTYVEQRVLSESEKALIEAWIDTGAPAGDIHSAPTPPIFLSSDIIAKPDLRVELPSYVSKARFSDEYRCFVVPTDQARDVFITGMEIVPGNPALVHHVLVFADPTDQPLRNEARDPEPGYTCFGGVGSPSAQLLGGWAPGQGPSFYPTGMGVRLPKGANLVVQVHYPRGTEGLRDDTKINFLLDDSPNTREVVVSAALNHFNMVNGPLFIPANTVRTFRQRITIPQDVTALSVLPHMHLIGRSIKVWGLTPLGDTLRIVDIPQWHFHWQGSYTFLQPVKAPRGTVLQAEAVYDNTVNNPFNPSNPPRDVRVGEATTDEMMLVFFAFTAYRPGDENLIIGEPRPAPVPGCAGLSNVRALQTSQAAFQLFPNPAAEIFWVSPSRPEPYTLRALNLTGQTVFSRQALSGDTELNAADWAPGVYLLELTAPWGKAIQRLVVRPR